MAIENTYLLGKNITLGCGFDLQAKAPLDSRQTVPSYAGLQALIDGNAAYEGMIVYDEETKKTYQAQLVDGTLAFREFGINEAELRDLIASETTAAMEFKGVASALPAAGAKGDMYKVSAGFAVEAANDAQAAGFDAKVGDSIVCDGDGKWFLIPSGDDIEDTWRPVTDVANDAGLTFAAGDKLDVAVASNGTITYSHEAIDAPTATPVSEDEQTRTYITEVITDGHGHITGYKTATENVEDTNTEYTFEGQSDEATSVYFQVTSSEEGAAAEVIYLDAYSKNEADEKITDAIDAVKVEIANQDAVVLSEAQKYADTHANVIESVKVNGTALTITDKAVDIAIPTGALAGKDKVAKTDLDEALANEIDNKVASVTAGDASVTVGGTATAPTVAAKISAAEGNALILAEDGLKVIIPESTKVEASEVNGNIKVDGQEVTVYEHPESHTASEISDFATEVAKVKVNEAAKADEATKAAQDGNGKVIADTYAEKATTLAGYSIADAYTKTEIDNLFTWGSF